MAANSVNIESDDNQQKILKLFNDIFYEEPKRYTIKIDKGNSNPTSRITYMNDAKGMKPAYMDYTNGVFNYGDWEDVWFIKENYPVMLKSDGTVDYRLDPNDYSKRLNGASSDITNTSYDGNAMSRFPKVYLSFTEDAGYEYISVSNVKYDETYEPIGFINDNGEEVNEIFLAIYRGYVYSSKLRSISGYQPTGSNTADNEIMYATNNGTGWYTRTWAQRQTVNALLTIISKSDNSQEAFGYGNCNSGSSSSYMSTSGTLNDKGQFYGYNDKTHQVKVFHIEGWWGDQYDRIAGLITDSSRNIKVAMHGPYSTTGSGSNYNTVYTASSNISGYGANCKCSNTCGRLPISKTSPGGTSGSTSTFLCDRLYIYTSSYLIVGGSCSYGLFAGSSCFAASAAASSPDWSVGASLSYLAS